MEKNYKIGDKTFVLDQTKAEEAFNSKKKHVSLADLIILGGNVGVEKAAAAAGKKIKLSFSLEEVMHPRIKLTYTLLVY